MIDQQEPQTWRLAVKVNYIGQAIFKTKRTKQNEFIMHLPKQKSIETFDMSLNSLKKTYKFQSQINAIQQVELQQGTFVAAGSKHGVIELQNINGQEKYFLTLEEQADPQQAYINDFAFFQKNILVNCYNTGGIAIWKLGNQLSNNLKPESYKVIHNSFFYKLRKIDNWSVLTSSNDFTAKIYDVERSEIVDTFQHYDSVWCAYPLNQNVFCVGGLLNKLIFWDSRSHRIVNKCELQNQQTSFITRLDNNNVIFGDQRQLAVCDLRKPSKVPFTSHRMRLSAETILVGQEGVIAAGRGGDVCLLKKGGSEIQCQQRNIGNAQPMLGWFNILRFNMLQQQLLDPDNLPDQWQDVQDDLPQEELNNFQQEFIEIHQDEEQPEAFEDNVLAEQQQQEEQLEALMNESEDSDVLNLNVYQQNNLKGPDQPEQEGQSQGQQEQQLNSHIPIQQGKQYVIFKQEAIEEKQVAYQKKQKKVQVQQQIFDEKREKVIQQVSQKQQIKDNLQKQHSQADK